MQLSLFSDNFYLPDYNLLRIINKNGFSFECSVSALSNDIFYIGKKPFVYERFKKRMDLLGSSFEFKKV